jgi:hypothetical protein
MLTRVLERVTWLEASDMENALVLTSARNARREIALSETGVLGDGRGRHRIVGCAVGRRHAASESPRWAVRRSPQ